MEESDRLDQARALFRERLGRYQTNLELPIQVRPLDPDEAIGKDRYWGGFSCSLPVRGQLHRPARFVAGHLTR